MNCVFNVVWSESRQKYVVASELASGSSRPVISVRAGVLGLMIAAVLASATSPALAHTSGVTSGHHVSNEHVSQGTQTVSDGGVASGSVVTTR